MEFQLYTSSKSVRVRTWFENLNDVILTPSLTSTDNFAELQIDINNQMKYKFGSISVNGRLKDNANVKTTYIKTAEGEKVHLSLSQNNYSWNMLNDQLIRKINKNQQPTYINKLSNIIDFDKEYLKNIYVEVLLDPTVYWIKTNILASGDVKEGTLSMVLTSINNSIETFIELSYTG